MAKTEAYEGEIQNPLTWWLLWLRAINKSGTAQHIKKYSSCIYGLFSNRGKHTVETVKSWRKYFYLKGVKVHEHV